MALPISDDLREEMRDFHAFLGTLDAADWDRETRFMNWTPWDVVEPGVQDPDKVKQSVYEGGVGTPFYVYSAATLTRHFRVFDEALDGLPHLVCYAMKANSNLAVIKLLGDLGAGMDVVSGGEYLRAKAAGVPGDRIIVEAF